MTERRRRWAAVVLVVVVSALALGADESDPGDLRVRGDIGAVLGIAAVDHR